jgi:hypothetical protein
MDLQAAPGVKFQDVKTAQRRGGQIFHRQNPRAGRGRLYYIWDAVDTLRPWMTTPSNLP